MKWIFYLMIALYMIFRVVYGEEINISREEDDEIWSVGEKHEILCEGTQKNQKLQWKDPNGNKVDPRSPGNTRVYSQQRAAHGSTPSVALIFARVGANDTGIWSCHSGKETLSTNVCVMEVASFVTTVTEVNINPGRAITLACEAHGTPEPLMLWYRDGNLITDEYVDDEPSKYKLMTKYNVQNYESLLTVSSLKAGDAGVYVCAAVQDNGLCTSNQTIGITLHLSGAPTILSGNASETIYEDYGGNVTLVCETEGYPIPEIIWHQEYPDGQVELDNGNDFTIVTEDNKSELQFVMDNRTAYESFSCTASNKYGKFEKLFRIIPLTAPVAPDKIILVYKTGTELTIKALWISLEEGHTFPVTGIKVQYMKASKVDSRRSWYQPDWPRPKTVSLDESELSVDPEGARFTVAGLSPDSTYWVRVRAYNDAGYSEWSKQVRFSTSELTPETEEREVLVEKHAAIYKVNNKMKYEEVQETTEAEILPGTTDRIAISDETEDTPVAVDSNNFYALVFGVGIFVVIGGCMFVMKKM